MRSIALSFVLLFSVPAYAGSIDEAREAVAAAIDAVRAAGDECKGSALSSLKDARDQLDAAARSGNRLGLSKARRGVEDALDESTGCDGEPKARMNAALQALQGAMEAADVAANTPSPAEQKLKEKRQCWNYRNDYSPVDPGCHVTWKGQYAMDKQTFIALEKQLQNEKDRFQQETILNRAFNWQNKDLITAMQLERLLTHIRGDVDRLQAVKKLAKRVVDMDNGSRVGRLFSDARARRDAVEEFKKRRY